MTSSELTGLVVMPASSTAFKTVTCCQASKMSEKPEKENTGRGIPHAARGEPGKLLPEALV